jgi:hypothetical protein
VVGDKADQALGRQRAGEVVAALVEGLVEDDGRGLDGGLGDGGRVGGEAEEVVVAVGLGKVIEGLFVDAVVGGEVGDDDDLVGLGELGVVGGGDLGDGG